MKNEVSLIVRNTEKPNRKLKKRQFLIYSFSGQVYEYLISKNRSESENILSFLKTYGNQELAELITEQLYEQT